MITHLRERRKNFLVKEATPKAPKKAATKINAQGGEDLLKELGLDL